MTNTHKKNIRLGIDLDGVIYNFVDEFREYYAKKYNVDSGTLEVNKFNFWTDWGMAIEEYNIELGTAAIRSEVFCNGEPYKHAVDSMMKLSEMDFDIVIITARQLSHNPEHMEIIEKNTRNWLAKHNIPYDELIIDNDKSRHDLDILIDDNLINLEAVLFAGGDGYVFDQPWNHTEMSFPRIMGWYDLVSTMLRTQEGYDKAIQKFLSSNTPAHVI